MKNSKSYKCNIEFTIHSNKSKEELYMLLDVKNNGEFETAFNSMFREFLFKQNENKFKLQTYIDRATFAVNLNGD